MMLDTLHNASSRAHYFLESASLLVMVITIILRFRHPLFYRSFNHRFSSMERLLLKVQTVIGQTKIDYVDTISDWNGK
jgi:hypothetical protein